MTSTSFNVGLNSASRNSSKVLKPPGGGSSDIFGSSDPVEPQRKARAHLSSNIFAEEPAAPARNKAGNSSFYNLFGSEPNVKPLTDSSNVSRSNSNPHIINESEKSLPTEDDVKKVSSTDKETEENEVLVETNGDTNASGCNEPPAPAESPVVNGTVSSTNSTVTSTAPTPTAPAPAAAAGRARVPPGGFSSGLW